MCVSDSFSSFTGFRDSSCHSRFCSQCDAWLFTVLVAGPLFTAISDQACTFVSDIGPTENRAALSEILHVAVKRNPFLPVQFGKCAESVIRIKV